MGLYFDKEVYQSLWIDHQQNSGLAINQQGIWKVTIKEKTGTRKIKKK